MIPLFLKPPHSFISTISLQAIISTQKVLFSTRFIPKTGVFKGGMSYWPVRNRPEAPYYATQANPVDATLPLPGILTCLGRRRDVFTVDRMGPPLKNAYENIGHLERVPQPQVLGTKTNYGNPYKSRILSGMILQVPIYQVIHLWPNFIPNLWRSPFQQLLSLGRVNSTIPKKVTFTQDCQVHSHTTWMLEFPW